MSLTADQFRIYKKFGNFLNKYPRTANTSVARETRRLFVASFTKAANDAKYVGNMCAYFDNGGQSDEWLLTQFQDMVVRYPEIAEFVDKAL
jgi:hypothetical protein